PWRYCEPLSRTIRMVARPEPSEGTRTMKRTVKDAVAVLMMAGLLMATASVRYAAQTRAETYAIRNARIVTVTGPAIEKGTVVIPGGKIAAVGPDVAVPTGATVIDATGMSVYPGMIDAGDDIGLVEISSVAGSVDTTEIGDNNANIHVDVAIH